MFTDTITNGDILIGKSGDKIAHFKVVNVMKNSAYKVTKSSNDSWLIDSAAKINRRGELASLFVGNYKIIARI